MSAGNPQTGGDGTGGPGLVRASLGLQLVLIGIVAIYDCLLIDDAFLAPAGRPDVLMRWRGLVWPALIILSVWAAHIWLAENLAALNRPSTRRQSALVYLLAATLLVCDVLSSSDAESWRARLGRRYPDPAANALLVTILLEDPGTGRGTRTVFDLRSSSLVRSAGLQGDKLPVTDDYFVANRRLRVGSLDVGSADGILYQAA